jgi:hypothetical protein
MALLGTSHMQAFACMQIFCTACIAMAPLCRLLEDTGEQQYSNLAYQVLSAAAACSIGSVHAMPTLIPQIEAGAAMASVGRKASGAPSAMGTAACQAAIVAAWLSRLLADPGTDQRVAALLRTSGQFSTAQLLEVYRQAAEALQGTLATQGGCWERPADCNCMLLGSRGSMHCGASHHLLFTEPVTTCSH